MIIPLDDTILTVLREGPYGAFAHMPLSLPLSFPDTQTKRVRTW